MSELKRHRIYKGGAQFDVYKCSDVDTEIAKLKTLLRETADFLIESQTYKDEEEEMSKTLREAAK